MRISGWICDFTVTESTTGIGFAIARGVVSRML
jgi:hypothetical protein